MPGENILVIEDDQDILELIIYNLRKVRYRVNGVLNGEEALEAVEREHPELIILDLLLPGIDAWRYCETSEFG